MARKSRKNLNIAGANLVCPLQNEAPKQKVGAYVRLSAGDIKKADSIENQKAIIVEFINNHTNLELADTYIDSGLSGQSFTRPAFNRMLTDILSKKINCIITKDLSRLGRNAIDAGYYIEKFFPTKGIRFIAITDNYDSADEGSSGIMLSLKNMLNEAYECVIISPKGLLDYRQSHICGRPMAAPTAKMLILSGMT